MTSTTPRAVPRSVGLAARVTTLLARTFPEYVPGEQDGFRVGSLDHQEPRRMYVRWYADVRERPAFSRGPATVGNEERRAQLAAALRRAGYAVTLPTGGWDVHVADRPVDDSGPRYVPVANDVPVSAPWLVMDQWTRVHADTAGSEEEAAAKAMVFERAHVLEDARIVADFLVPFLERADALLGDGVQWLYQEVHDGARYGELKQLERLDALVRVASALRSGREVAQEGRMVTYGEPYPMLTRPHPSLTYQVRWVPKSSAPAVGYFPDPAWQYGPVVDAAITLLAGAGLRPVVYGESIGPKAFQVEQEGFMVTGDGSGVRIDSIGAGAPESVADVLRAAGWRVAADEGWPGAWEALPPAE